MKTRLVMVTLQIFGGRTFSRLAHGRIDVVDGKEKTRVDPLVVERLHTDAHAAGKRVKLG
jgi:hypothetical protein